MSRYHKTISAVVTGVLLWTGGVIASASGPITAMEWYGLATALAVALGVYIAPANSK